MFEFDFVPDGRHDGRNDGDHGIGSGGIFILSILLVGRLALPGSPLLPGGQLVGPLVPEVAGQPGVLDARGGVNRVLRILVGSVDRDGAAGVEEFLCRGFVSKLKVYYFSYLSIYLLILGFYSTTITH